MSSFESVPFLDLRAQHASIKTELLRAFQEAVDTARFVGGPSVESFEREFASYVACTYGVGVASGTDALRFALLAMDIGRGDNVITVPNTFIATASSIVQTGAGVEFVDVDRETGLLDPNRLEDLLKRRFARANKKGNRPAAVIPVHLYGQCVEMEPVLELARRYDLKVLEDAAQAHGATCRGRSAGSFGDAAAFSFYPGKNLGACGEAGMVTTNDRRLAEKVTLLRDHGRETKHRHVIEGYNGRLDAVQAEILRVKLRRLQEWNAARRRWAQHYDEAFSTLETVEPIAVRHGNVPVYHLYVVRCPERDRLQEYLRQRSISTGIHYPIPLHQQPCFRDRAVPDGLLPNAERLAGEILSLPIFPELEGQQVDRVVHAVRAFDAERIATRPARKSA